MSVLGVTLLRIFPASSRIRIEYGERRIISPYLVRMQKNTGKTRTRITPNIDTFYTMVNSRKYFSSFGNRKSKWCNYIEFPSYRFDKNKNVMLFKKLDKTWPNNVKIYRIMWQYVSSFHHLFWFVIFDNLSQIWETRYWWNFEILCQMNHSTERDL